MTFVVEKSTASGYFFSGEEVLITREMSADAFVKEQDFGHCQFLLTIASMQHYASVIMTGCTFLIVHENAVSH